MSDQFDAKAFLKTVTSQPGVYRMYDAGGTVIYVGKAKDLKKRLSSYFRSNLASRKTEALVAQIQQIDVTVTHTETEALLLEHNYIKLYQPRSISELCVPPSEKESGVTLRIPIT